jgi:hypothetical protein
MGKREEIVSNTQEQARDAFANHTIRKRTACSWYCGKEGGGSEYYFEVLLGINGTTIVHGDIDTVVLNRFGSWNDPIAALGWMAGHDDLDYVAEKARMGLSLEQGHDGTTSLNAEVFIEEVREHVAAYYGEGEGPEYEGWAERVIGWAKGGKAELEYHLATEAHDLDPDALEDGLIWSFGRIPSRRLIYAHEAVRWLWMTLQAERIPTHAELSDEEAKVEEERANAG